MNGTEPPPIELQAVSYVLDGTAILDGIDLTVQPREIVGIMGRSGTGKTTLLRLMMGLIPPAGGRVLVKGADITALDEPELDRLREHMGMVFQGAALFDSMTVFENVAFALVEHRKLPPHEIAARVAERFSPALLHRAMVSPVVGTHVGPGAIGLAFYAERP